MNLIQNFKKLPLLDKHMKNRYTFSKYIYDLHELINKMLGKKSGLKYCDVKERYEHFRARCNKTIKNRDVTSKKKGKWLHRTIIWCQIKMCYTDCPTRNKM